MDHHRTQSYGRSNFGSVSTMGDRQEVLKKGLAALQAGHASEAIGILEPLLESGQPEPALHVALAIANRDIGAKDSALNWTEKALSQNPMHVRALLLKGELLASQGNLQAAAAHYQLAIRVVGNAADVPLSIRDELKRATDFCNGISRSVEISIREKLKGIQGGTRFDESVDCLLGKRQPYFSQPRFYFYPGLPHRSFFGNDEFPFIKSLEAATPAIRAELTNVLDDATAFEPYVRSMPDRPPNSQAGMADNPAWGAFYLWKDGQPVEENLARCPSTAEAIAKLPLCDIPGRSPSVLFSRLLPGAHIPAHHGFVNTRLIGHLPLVVPPGCRFRVGNEVREWREGHAWMFDDSIEHEAWNDSALPRVILLFEVWRPELCDAERAAIRTLFSALDGVSGGAPKWDM